MTTKYVITAAISSLLLSTVGCYSAQAKETLEQPLQKNTPAGYMSTPVEGYFLDLNSIKFNQQNSSIIKYDMVSNLKDDEVLNQTHSLRTHYLVNCKEGVTSDVGITAFKELFGRGNEQLTIPRALNWEILPEVSAKTLMAKTICIRMNQNYKLQTPKDVRDEFNNMLKH